jgi:hypothetical protein
MPDTPGEAQVRVFLDSACTVFSGSADYVQWAYLTTIVEAGSKYAYLQLAKYNRNIYWGEQPSLQPPQRLQFSDSASFLPRL